jgi:hypothetical protein
MSFRRTTSLACFVLILLIGHLHAQVATLSPDAEQVANLIGVAPQIEELRRLSGERNDSDRMRTVALRQDIYVAVLAASLDVDSVIAEMDNESAQLAELRAGLQSKRDRALKVTTIGNIVAGAGSGILGTALQLNDNTAILGDQIGVGTSAASTALQIYSLHQQRGGAVATGRVPNMLARLFDRPAALRSIYPDDVWMYLNSPPSGIPQTRLQALLAEWAETGRIGRPDLPQSQGKIDLLTSSMNKGAKLSIDTITDRLAMVADVRGRVLLMKRDLANLLRSLR